MVMLDANMILRYLLNDNAEMAEEAERYLEAGKVYVSIEVIAEVVYVLKGVYSLERGHIADIIKQFLALVECRDAEVLNVALVQYAECSLDFVDCVLYGYNKAGCFEIATFDKKLRKLIEDN